MKRVIFVTIIDVLNFFQYLHSKIGYIECICLAIKYILFGCHMCIILMLVILFLRCCFSHLTLQIYQHFSLRACLAFFLQLLCELWEKVILKKKKTSFFYDLKQTRSSCNQFGLFPIISIVWPIPNSMTT